MNAFVTVKTARAGSTIPGKVELGGAMGLDVRAGDPEVVPSTGGGATGSQEI